VVQQSVDRVSIRRQILKNHPTYYKNIYIS
jgi:hypothetical protein